MINDDRLRSICQKLKPLVGPKADALWLAYLTSENMKVKQEAEALIHMFAARHLGRDVDERQVLLPPPDAATAGGEFPLGQVVYRDRVLFPLGLRRENLIKHVGIFAITGAGKTNLAQHLLLGLLKADIPFLVIDWKRSYRSLQRLDVPGIERLRVFSVGRSDDPFRWNPLRPPPGVHPRTWVGVIAEVLEKSHISGPGVADIFMDVLDRKFEVFGF